MRIINKPEDYMQRSPATIDLECKGTDWYVFHPIRLLVDLNLRLASRRSDLALGHHACGPGLAVDRKSAEIA
jgi:hypothetical protein